VLLKLEPNKKKAAFPCQSCRDPNLNERLQGSQTGDMTTSVLPGFVCVTPVEGSLGKFSSHSSLSFPFYKMEKIRAPLLQLVSTYPTCETQT
jgi:hypothetical protein